MDDREIDELLTTPKRISEPPAKKWREELAQRRKDFRLESEDGVYRFRVFLRQSTVYVENFSVGLEYEPANGNDPIVLIRCNGPHGDFNGQLNPEHWHFHPHVHKASSQALAKGERAERYATRTTAFATVDEAITFFLERVNVSMADQELYFGQSSQGSLFSETEFE